MSGLKLTIPTTFTNPALPYLRDDAVLPKQGAMMLIDPMHPAGAWAAGVPTDGAYLPNLADDQLSVLLASSAQADIQPKMFKPSGFSGAVGLLERSSKGGLHGISSKVSSVQATGPAIAFSTKMMAYILANPKHDYYMSLWARVTREPAAAYNNSSLVAINGSGQQTNSYLFNVASSGATASPYPLNMRPASAGGPTRLGFREDGSTAPLGNKFVSVGTDQWWSQGAGLTDSLPGDGTNTTVTGTVAGGGLTWGSTVSWPGIGSTGTVANGTFNPAGASSNTNKADSHITYRFYMEDLTVSGRSYAAVDAISWAEYTKHVLTAGGRYYGDTFTAPSTLP